MIADLGGESDEPWRGLYPMNSLTLWTEGEWTGCIDRVTETSGMKFDRSYYTKWGCWTLLTSKTIIIKPPFPFVAIFPPSSPHHPGFSICPFVFLKFRLFLTDSMVLGLGVIYRRQSPPRPSRS